MQENDEGNDDTFALGGGGGGGRRSKSIQATLDKNQAYRNPRFRAGGHSLEFSPDKKYPQNIPKTSETINLIDRRTGGANPGTSSMTPAVISSFSIQSQVNETCVRSSQEGSLAVVYSYDDRNAETSKSSNLGFLYGSQGSRRFSDETVILIEDYQSYDYANTARIQEVDHGPRRSRLACCWKSRRRTEERLRRPATVELEQVLEEDEILVCRICHEGEDVEPLLQPCLCKGSVGSVHASCLKVWLEQSNTRRCELCNYPYATRQTRKYKKWLSVKVFFRTIINRRTLAYDLVSFVVITPLTIVGVAMCIQASLFSSGNSGSDSSSHMGNVTKAGMIMLSGTIIVAYGVWLYTLISYHYKSWKKWYGNCYDVEVIPVRMTSEERLEAARRLSEEMSRRQMSRERGSALLTVLQSGTPAGHSFYQRRVSIGPVFSGD